MDVILALGATIRKMFAADAVLSLTAVLLVAATGLLVRMDVLGADLAPWLLMVGVALVLIIATSLALFKTIRKTGK
jgi:hypothetical protein